MSERDPFNESDGLALAEARAEVEALDSAAIDANFRRETERAENHRRRADKAEAEVARLTALGLDYPPSIGSERHTEWVTAAMYRDMERKLREAMAEAGALAVARIKQEREVERLQQRNEWMRCAHMLVAQDEAFFREPDGGVFTYNDALPTVVDGDPALLVICSDTFAYACADAEHADYADAAELLRLGAEEGWPGLIRWVQSRRHERGEPADPIAPVAEHMATMDSLREQRDDANSRCRRAAQIIREVIGSGRPEVADLLHALGPGEVSDE